MSLKKNPNQGMGVGTSGASKNQNQTKRVADIILSRNHPAYLSEDDIGTIFFSEVGFNQESLNTINLPKAKPLNRNNFQYPVIGELVQIINSTSNNIYSDLEGDISATTNYYTPAINVHNNTASNSLPAPKKTKKKKPKRSSNIQRFQFKKEFKSPSREVARKQLSNYLRNLGYTSGTNDPRAPRYSLFENASGEYIFRLDDSKGNVAAATKLGNYFKENPELKPLTPGEGDSIIEGKGGQRIRQTITGPTGTNVFSNGVTDAPDDGNPSIGNAAMALSIGKGSQENITKDAASIYLCEDQKINIDATSTNVDSLKSTYTPSKTALEELTTEPDVPISNPLEDDDLTVTDTESFFSFETGSANPVADPVESFEPPTPDPDPDPVFAALDEAEEAGLIEVYREENLEISGTEIDESQPNPNGGQPFDFNEGGEDFQRTTNYNTADIIANLNPSELGNRSFRQNNYKTTCAIGRSAWNKGFYNDAIFANQQGDLLLLPPPDPKLTMNKTNKRNIKYLCIHCTAGWSHRTPADTFEGFFTSRTLAKNEAEVEKSSTARKLKSDGIEGAPYYWQTGGYHWFVQPNGKATRAFPDKHVCWGASGANGDGIHLNWIGGFNSIWQYTPTIDIANKFNISEGEAYSRLYSMGSFSSNVSTGKRGSAGSYEGFTGYNNGDPTYYNGNLITLPQLFTLFRLVKKYVELYPGIIVVGHNQGASKPCPLFDVPTLCNLLGIDSNSTPNTRFNGSNGHPYREYLVENSKVLYNALNPPTT